MSEPQDDTPLAPHLRAALLAEGLEGGPSDDQRARMAAKLALAVGVPAAALLGAKALGTAATGASAAATGGTSAAATTATAGKALSAKAIALVVGSLVVGTGVGVTIGELHGRSAAAPHPTTPIAPVATTIDAAIAPPDAALVDAPAPDADATAQRARPDARTATHPDAASADQLARERELIDVARSALRAGDTRLATKNLVEHELRFPSGALTEERRALAIEVAMAAGDRAKAQTLAAEFRSMYPHSVFQARIDDLLR